MLVIAPCSSGLRSKARALATLDHPGIVHATDFGQLLGGSPYLVMEFVTGISLHDLGHAQLSYPIVWSIIDHRVRPTLRPSISAGVS